MVSSTVLMKELIEKAETYLRSKNYCNSTIQGYQIIWKRLLSHYRCSSSILFSENEFYESICQILRINKEAFLTNHQVFCVRAAKLLDEIHQDKIIARCRQRPGVRVVDCFSEMLDSYLDYQTKTGIAQKTVKSKSIQMTRFLNYLHNQGISDIDLLTSDLILAYTNDLRKKYTRNTASGVLFTLRNFLLFLYERKLSQKTFHQLFPVIYSDKNDRLPSYYHEEELQKILASVDRNTIIGKRDYLVLILAIQLGIRAGDIRRLKFSDIHWEKSTIEFSQHKTGNPISLPLLENIRYALIEFIKDSRPESSSHYVFIRNRAPYEPYTSYNVFYYVITEHLKNAGIDYNCRKHGLHAMRHSLASNLLKNNTPYPVITGILGHESSNTTKIYLNIDILELRSVALEVPYEG